jgi:hypothetical protein
LPKNAAPRVPLTAERLRELLAYDPETGEFRWRVNRTHGVKAGDPAGSVNREGYIRVSIYGVKYLAHRLAWLMVRGEWPPEGFEIDHENRKRSDNRGVNLRLATCSQNQANVGISRRNRSGFRGVSFCKAAGRWEAHFRDSGSKRHLGLFDTPEAAGAVAQAARAAAFGAFAGTT